VAAGVVVLIVLVVVICIAKRNRMGSGSSSDSFLQDKSSSNDPNVKIYDNPGDVNDASSSASGSIDEDEEVVYAKMDKFDEM
jgi:hypothetical protein